MSSERRTIQGEVPDGVADRAQGYTHNPNPEDQLAAQRARFAEQQQQIQQDREEAAEAISEVEANLAQQYRAAQQDPDHQAFVPEQQVEQEMLGFAGQPGGQQGGSDYTDQSNFNAGAAPQPLPIPTQPRRDVRDDNDRT